MMFTDSLYAKRHAVTSGHRRRLPRCLFMDLHLLIGRHRRLAAGCTTQVTHGQCAHEMRLLGIPNS